MEHYDHPLAFLQIVLDRQKIPFPMDTKQTVQPTMQRPRCIRHNPVPIGCHSRVILLIAQLSFFALH